MQLFYDLFSNVLNFTWQEVLMILTGGLLIYLAVKREMEPALLLPMGFGAILVNLPFAGTEAVEALFNAGIASELFPLLLFIGIGAMIDFGPLLSNPKMFLFYDMYTQGGVTYTPSANAERRSLSKRNCLSAPRLGDVSRPASPFWKP